MTPRRLSGTLACLLAGFCLRCFFFELYSKGAVRAYFCPIFKILVQNCVFFFFRGVSSYFGPGVPSVTYVMNHQIDDVRTCTTTTTMTDNSDDDTSVTSTYIVLWGLYTTACVLTLHTTVVVVL